jgi:DNA-binding MarR family transcriptional regulator
MLESLEELGLVCREVAKRDRRQREVLLTEKGRQCVREAYRMVVRWVLRFVYEVICGRKHRDPEVRFTHMSTLEDYLRGLRTYCRDSATLYYPWGHPDD